MDEKFYHQLLEELKPAKVQLLAVSKTRTPEEIQELYDLGQRDFGENYVQELVDKQAQTASRYPLAFYRTPANAIK